MKKVNFYLGTLFIIQISLAQVGIGTTNPDPSSLLEISATDKGILIPQVSLDNVTTTMLDGVNTAATGLLIYNTNAAVTGGNGIGYYYFNGTQWQSFEGAKKIDDLTDGKSDSDGSSVFLGMNAGENDDSTDNRNIGIGFNSLYSNTTGSSCTAIGTFALYSNTTGFNNTSIGTYTLYSNTTGYSNNAVGYESLYSNTTGQRNVAQGKNSLYSNTTGSACTAIGTFALYSNTTGFNNISIGTYTLYYNTTGSYNTAIGNDALYFNTLGIRNTANGSSSLMSNTTGNNNTAIGRDALSINTTGDNNTGIGYGAQVPDGTLNNQVRIGNSSVGYYGIQVGWTVTSDIRWKEKIRQLPFGLDVLMQLKPVDYVRKNNKHETREMGFIAQDVEALLNKIGYVDQGFLSKDEKGYMSLRYNDFIALLTKAIQEQQIIIEDQNKNYEYLLKRVEQLELAATH